MTRELAEGIVWTFSQILLLHVFFKWLEKRWPPRPHVDLSHLDAETRRRLAKRVNVVGTLVGIALWPVLTAAWFLLFFWLQDATLPAIPGAVFVRRPTRVVHMIPATFAGITLTGPVMIGLTWLWFGRRFREVMAVGDAHYKMDARTQFYLMFVWIVPLCLDFDMAFLGRLTAFTPDRIVHRGLLIDRAQERPYSDVVKLEYVDGFRWVHNDQLPDKRFKITFRDGSEWTSHNFFLNPRPDDPDLLKYVAGRSGIVPVRVRDF